MSISIFFVLLFLIAVIVGAVRREFQTSTYWFHVLIGVAILKWVGALGILGV